jgi:hypothetical protein
MPSQGEDTRAFAPKYSFAIANARSLISLHISGIVFHA